MNNYLIAIISNYGVTKHCVVALSERLAINELLIAYEKDGNTCELKDIKCEKLNDNKSFSEHHYPHGDDYD